MATNNPCKVVTGPRTRWAYCNVWEPKQPLNGGRPKYSVKLIIPKGDMDTITAVDDAIRAAYDEGYKRLRGDDAHVPSFGEIKWPVQDGDTPGLRNAQDYAGCWLINANSDRAPQIVDAHMRPVIEHSRVYSGVYGRASISFYAYNKGGGKRGIACCLHNLQLIKAGEPLGTRSDAQHDFGEE